MNTEALPEAVCLQRARPRQADVRGEYFRDQTAIIHSTPFRRLKHKAQVFFAPENDHICTRIEHVLHVATIASTLCRGLAGHGWRLDTELAYAAGLGHDLGHAPFGHAGESALAKKMAPFGGFEHERHSLRVVDFLARDGLGLNLTWAVRDGIVCHNGEQIDRFLTPDASLRDPKDKAEQTRRPATWEGCAVRFADKIAYLGRDIEDALAAGFLERRDVPQTISRELGSTNGEIIDALVTDLIEHSALQGKLGYSDEKYELLCALQRFNYERIYGHPRLHEYERHSTRIVLELFDFLMEAAERWSEGQPSVSGEVELAFIRYLDDHAACYAAEGTPTAQRVADYIAGMTDNFCLTTFSEMVLPRPISFPVHV